MPFVGSCVSILQLRNYHCRFLWRDHVLDESILKYKFRPKNDIRVQKAFLRCVKLLSTIHPDMKPIITRYFVDLGTEYGFTKKHMIKLFEGRMRYRVPTETENQPS